MYFWTAHFIALFCAVKMSPWSCQMDKYWSKEIWRNWLLNVAYNPLIFPTEISGKNPYFYLWKTLCNSSTHFAYFNSWQKVDGQTSIVKFGHHSSTYLEGLTKLCSFGGSSAPPYSPFCTLKTCTFDPTPLVNLKYQAHLGCKTRGKPDVFGGQDLTSVSRGQAHTE